MCSRALYVVLSCTRLSFVVCLFPVEKQNYALSQPFYCLVVGDVAEEGVGAGGGVDLAAVVGHAVADNQEAGVEHEVVSHNLVEHVLRDFHRRRFILHNHCRPAVAVEDDGVAAAGSAVQFDAPLVGDKAYRIAEIFDEMVDEILSDPFLRRQGDEFHAYAVENLERVAVATDACIGVFGKIQFLHNRLFSAVKLRFYAPTSKKIRKFTSLFPTTTKKHQWQQPPR